MAWEPRLVAARARTVPAYDDVVVEVPVAPAPAAVSRSMAWVLRCGVLVLVSLIGVYVARHTSSEHVSVVSIQSSAAPAPAGDEAVAAAVAAVTSGELEVEPEIIDMHRAAPERRAQRASGTTVKAKSPDARRDAKTKTTAKAKAKKTTTSETPVVDKSGKPGFLTIDSVPYSTVYVDGTSVGDTPLIRVRMSPGAHEVRAVTADGRVKNLRVKVKGGETIRHKLQF